MLAVYLVASSPTALARMSLTPHCPASKIKEYNDNVQTHECRDAHHVPHGNIVFPLDTLARDARARCTHSVLWHRICTSIGAFLALTDAPMISLSDSTDVECQRGMNLTIYSLGSWLAHGPAHIWSYQSPSKWVLGLREPGSMRVYFSVVSASPEWDKDWEIDTDFYFYVTLILEPTMIVALVLLVLSRHSVLRWREKA